MRRSLLVGLGLLVVLGAAAAVAWRMLPFTTVHLLQDLLRGSLPDGAVTVLCRTPLRLPSTQPVPGLLTLVVDGDTAPPTLSRGGLTATRTDRGPWGATYALPPGEDPLVWARAIPDSEPVWERVISGGATPDDPGLPRQWHLQSLGLEKVRAHDATGEGVIVAVIDTGVTAGEDGPIDVLRGVDVLDGSGTTEDLNVHGSVVAALIAQTTNNRRGYASLAPDVKILPIRACGATGSCRSDHIAKGIYAAVDQGAKVINLSVSGRIPSDQEARAIRHAVRKGRVVVAAAGNEAGTVGWPASIPEVIAVGALSRQGGVARYSNRGWGLDFWAPGGDCVEPVRQEVAHGDELAWGTSVAAPLVSASIAVGIGTGLRPAEVVRRLERTREEIPGERGGVIRPWMIWDREETEPDEEDGRIPMVKVMGGRFLMGTFEAEDWTSESPQHLVQVSTYWMGKSEVTQAQWRACVHRGQVRGDLDASRLQEVPTPKWMNAAERDRPVVDLLPVIGVSWCDAARFANALSRLEGRTPAYTVGADCERGGAVAWHLQATGYRLPTEAEWEYAARAGTGTDFGTGNEEGDLAQVGWYVRNSGNRSHPVCTAAVKPWGLCDMYGNVQEWVWDWYDRYQISVVDNPVGPPHGVDRVIRGGFWWDPPAFSQAAQRRHGKPSGSNSYMGFRIVLPSEVRPVASPWP